MNPSIARVTRLKPDFTYGFSIISPHGEVFRVLGGDEQVDSFSLLVLAELRNRGEKSLISAPTAALDHWAAKKKTKFLEAKD